MLLVLEYDKSPMKPFQHPATNFLGIFQDSYQDSYQNQQGHQSLLSKG